MDNPCLRCGAYCAHYRVSFYWSEAEPLLGGCVPNELTEPLNHHLGAMRGTLQAPVRCVALEGKVGEAVCCSIYEKRSSACRDLEPWGENGHPTDKCSRARAAHNLPPLDPGTGRPQQSPAPPWPLTA
ncbi:MAG: YkgJ family cysteine cluster protein [Thiobacillus sp.]|nr:YkgJ family cysteine cluster protein [Thiobacillus sp.]